MQIIKEPLLHFLFIAVMLFMLYGYLQPNTKESDARQIIVTRDQLLTYMQYRAKVFDAGQFNTLFDKLSEEKRQSLIDEYIKEEALYREAKALGLDKNDYGARQRLIQRLNVITRGLVSNATVPSEQDLVSWLSSHKDRYYVAPVITFTHVYFSQDKHGQQQAQTLANNTLKTLNQNQVPFHAAMSYGDRFLYHVNYVKKEPDEIASYFGESMQQQLFLLHADEQRWQGPFQSTYGFHLVMVAAQTEGYHPGLDELRSAVTQDVMQQQINEAHNTAQQSIVDQYHINIADDIAVRNTGKETLQ